jgi:hypothetical protein
VAEVDAVKQIKTPRTWPANAQPTAEQLADWLRAMPRVELVQMCEQFIRDGETASRCWREMRDDVVAMFERRVREDSTP